MSKNTTHTYNETSEKIVSLLSQLSEHFYEPLRFGTGEERKPVTKADLEKLQSAYEKLHGIATACGLKVGNIHAVFIGTVTASYKELVEAFGQPKAGDGYKTEAEWDVELIEGVFVQIYNYKNSRSYNSKNPTIKRVREWSVNGTDSDAIEWVKGMLGQDTK